MNDLACARSAAAQGCSRETAHPPTTPATSRPRASSSLLPTFLIIGAMKSGTSSLYFYLKQHPDIYLTDIKEPHFFAFDEPSQGATAAPGYRRQESYMVTDRAAYEALFAGASPSQARGEASAMYLYYPGTAERIRAALPEVQLIAVLRNPIERAYSAFLHQVREGKETVTDFGEALQLEEERIAQDYVPMWHYQRAGFYFEQLSRYYAVFDPSQIHVYLYEDLQRDAVSFVQNLYRVVGVDPTFTPDTTKQYNRSGVPKNRLLHNVHQFLKGTHPIKTVGKHLLPSALRSRLKRNLIAELEAKNLQKPPLDPTIRTQLAELYREDILKLQHLIGRDLSHWLA